LRIASVTVRALLYSYGGTALASVPVLHALSASWNPVAAYLLGLVPLVLLSGYFSLAAIVKSELYPAHVRAVGVALPYAIAQALFAGNTETVALYLKKVGHESWIYWLVAGMLTLLIPGRAHAA
jgi:MHS family alpha-ketoglutarate permease-like MFS transporter